MPRTPRSAELRALRSVPQRCAALQDVRSRCAHPRREKKRRREREGRKRLRAARLRSAPHRTAAPCRLLRGAGPLRLPPAPGAGAARGGVPSSPYPFVYLFIYFSLFFLFLFLPPFPILPLFPSPSFFFSSLSFYILSFTPLLSFFLVFLLLPFSHIPFLSPAFHFSPLPSFSPFLPPFFSLLAFFSSPPPFSPISLHIFIFPLFPYFFFSFPSYLFASFPPFFPPPSLSSILFLHNFSTSKMFSPSFPSSFPHSFPLPFFTSTFSFSFYFSYHLQWLKWDGGKPRGDQQSLTSWFSPPSCCNHCGIPLALVEETFRTVPHCAEASSPLFPEQFSSDCPEQDSSN